MSADLGEAIRRSLQLSDENGDDVAPDSIPTWSVTLPDLTAGISPVVHTGMGVGQFYVDYPTIQAGLHADVWTAVVGGLTAKFAPDTFAVRATSPGSVLSLTEARRALRIESEDPDRDEEIRDVLDGIVDLIEGFTGRVYRRQQFTETHDGGGGALLLRRTPVISIVTVVEGGSTLTAGNWTLDDNAGLLHRGGTVAAIPWLWGRQNITVNYVAGASVCPPRVRDAAKIALMHRWGMYRHGSDQPRIVGSDGEYATNSPGSALPREVELMLARDTAPGFA